MKLQNKKSLLVTIGLAFLMLVALEFFVLYSITITRERIITDLDRKAYAIQNEMDKILLNVYTISDAYASFLTDNPSITKEESEQFLQHLMEYEEIYVRNIAYIDGTIITFNYPFEENQSSIGVDLSAVEAQNRVIQELIETKEHYFQGPLELVQGGNAFILRTPILENDEYVGHVSTVIDADLLFQALDSQAKSNNVALKVGYNHQESFLELGDDFTGEKSSNQMSTTYVDFVFTVYDQSGIDYIGLINTYARIIGISLIVVVSYYFYKNRVLVDRIKYNLYHDSLTGIFNRDKFINDFKEGHIQNHLVAFFDINKFKVLNDTLGHHFGDWGLAQISKDFEQLELFTTYRNSGDEFILVSKERMTSDRFNDVIQKMQLSYYNDELKRNIDITLSIGVIENVPATIKLEDMLVYLDYAMYDAKRHNRTMTIVDSKLLEVYKEQKYIEQLLIDDIKDNQLVLYYQPIINIKEKRVESLEVLSRWKYKGEIIAAARFIDVAKKIRYIEVIDKNLFDKLQDEYKSLMKDLDNYQTLNYAVNFSAETLKLFEEHRNVFDKFVENNIIPKEKLIFEVSEDINLGIISNETLDYIKESGYGLVIDDFGSGVSKLTDVLSGKLLAIKTDRNMLPTDYNDESKLKGFHTIVKAINATGSTVIVEGVETLEQLEICRNAGVETMQGYLFGKPMPYDEIVHFIKTFDFNKYE